MNEIFYKVNDVVYRISEGDGGNLLKEDIENGYVDYIYYEIYNADDLDNEIDGGMILLKEYFQDKYKSNALGAEGTCELWLYGGLCRLPGLWTFRWLA